MSTINTPSNLHVPKFDLVITDDNLQQAVRTVLTQIRPEWFAGAGDSLDSKVLTGGLTNKIVAFFLRGHPNDQIIFKIYGDGTDSIIDRDKEIQTMTLLNRYQLGSRLDAVFTNGIAYEYIPGAILNMRSCHQPEVYRLVAAKMGRLHSIPLSETIGAGDSTTPIPTKPLIWDMIDKFTRLVADIFEKQPDLTATFAKIGVNIEWARRETAELRRLCEAQDPPMPIVFTHNDLLLGNIIYNSGGSGSVSFIDFEYAGPNYGPYDVANHFNEFSGVEPEEINYSNYPSAELRADWIQVYMQNFNVPRSASGIPDQPTFKKWVTLCTPLSHLTWIIWCVIQASSSKLEFDYVQYARDRFPQYEKDMKVVREVYGGA